MQLTVWPITVHRSLCTDHFSSQPQDDIRLALALQHVERRDASYFKFEVSKEAVGPVA